MNIITFLTLLCTLRIGVGDFLKESLQGDGEIYFTRGSSLPSEEINLQPDEQLMFPHRDYQLYSIFDYIPCIHIELPSLFPSKKDNCPNIMFDNPFHQYRLCYNLEHNLSPVQNSEPKNYRFNPMTGRCEPWP